MGFATDLADRRTVIHFDNPGSGLSDREDADVSLDAQVECVRAVIDGISGGRADVYGWGISAAVAVAFAARYPEKTRKLILSNPCVKGSEIKADSTSRKLMALATQDWEFLVTNLVSLLGVPPGEQGTLADTLVKETSQDSIARLAEWMDGVDVSAELPLVQAPTLVLRPRSDPLVPAAHVAQIAAGIQASRLAVVDTALVGGILRSNRDLVWEFLDDAHRSRSDEPELRIILFTDIQDHTAMMQRLGDEAGRSVLREHERVTRAAFTRFGGSEVKALGDGFMAWFGSAQRALECAASLQDTFAERTGDPVIVRVGINAGEPIAEDDDLFGASVITAARVAAEASGGEVLVSNVVRELVAGKGFSFTPRGDVRLKGTDESVHVYALDR